jgi:putative cofactor-binding repeat protein
VDALDDLADAGTHASFVAQVGHVLAGLANDDACLFGRDNGTERDLRVGILLLGPGRYVAVVIDGNAVEGLAEATGLRLLLGFLCRHSVGME